MRTPRLLRYVLFGLGAVVAALAVLVGGSWLYVTEPWYDGQVIRQLRAGTRNAPSRDETPRLAALFPDAMAGDSARSLLGASGFRCSQADTQPGKDIRLSCLRETRDFICVGTYTVDLTIDRDGGVTARRGESYLTCL